MSSLNLKVLVIGGAGYTAGELIRILLNHPHVELDFVYSTSQPGKPVSTIHQDLAGETEITFTDTMALMLTFFVLMFAMSEPKPEYWSDMASALHTELKPFDVNVNDSGPVNAINLERVGYNKALDLNYLEEVLQQFFFYFLCSFLLYLSIFIFSAFITFFPTFSKLIVILLFITD